MVGSDTTPTPTARCGFLSGGGRRRQARSRTPALGGEAHFLVGGKCSSLRVVCRRRRAGYGVCCGVGFRAEREWSKLGTSQVFAVVTASMGRKSRRELFPVREPVRQSPKSSAGNSKVFAREGTSELVSRSEVVEVVPEGSRSPTRRAKAIAGAADFELFGDCPLRLGIGSTR